jgi:hypothetical protein
VFEFLIDNIFVIFGKAIFRSVLRQFKIVKPTHQQGEKTNKLFKRKNAFACCMDGNTTKIRSIPFINKGNTQQRVKMKNND